MVRCYEIFQGNTSVILKSIISSRNAFVLVLTLLIILIVGYLSIFGQSHSDSQTFTFAKIIRGDIDVSINATGTVEPEEVVDVGAQVAGLILSFGTDAEGKAIDYGSRVEEGTILAEIDKSLYESDVSQGEAQLKRAKADVLASEAMFRQAERDWKRAESIGQSDALSKSAFDAYKASFESAQAQVEVARAQVLQAEATLSKAKRNLSLCTIKSPVKGVIIDRRVNIGQTVVSSFNAPSLFLIAKDLNKMQVWVSVNEADIGNIRPGQRVFFTVDAFPEEEFVGEVGKIRLNATMNQNVVTYIVEVVTDNSKGRLLPYLTANVKFEVSNRLNVLLAPNASLRFSPNTKTISTNNIDSSPQTDNTNENNNSRDNGVLWQLKGNHLKAIKVKTGGTDGINTEIVTNELNEGDSIIVAEESSDVQTETSSPFTPNIRRRSRNP